MMTTEAPTRVVLYNTPMSTVRTNPFQRAIIETRGESIELPDGSMIKAWIRERTEVDNDSGAHALIHTYTLWVDTPSKGTLAGGQVIHASIPARSYWVQSVYDLQDGFTQGVLTVHN